MVHSRTSAVRETSPLKKIGFVYLVREMSEGNVYIPVKKKIIRVRDSCHAIIFEIDQFVIYTYHDLICIWFFFFHYVPNHEKS